MKNGTPTQVFSCSFCEIFYIFSSKRLLLSMKGTKNCLYCRECCKYDSAVKKKDLELINLVKINSFIASKIFLQSALRRQLSISSFIYMSEAVVT